MFVASIDAARELIDGGGLVAARLIVAAQLEVHGRVSRHENRALPKLLLYSRTQIGVASASEGRLSGVSGWSFGEEQHLGVALGVDGVMDAVRTVGFGDDDIQGLIGVFGGANDEAGL